MSSKDKTTDASSNSPVCKFWPTLSEFCQDWTLELSFSYIISFEMPSSLLPMRGSLSLAAASNKPNCVVYRCVSWILYLIRSDQLLSPVRLFATPWIAARQASLSITNSRSSLRLTSIESVMPSSGIGKCCFRKSFKSSEFYFVTLGSFNSDFFPKLFNALENN